MHGQPFMETGIVAVDSLEPLEHLQQRSWERYSLEPLEHLENGSWERYWSPLQELSYLPGGVTSGTTLHGILPQAP